MIEVHKFGGSILKNHEDIDRILSVVIADGIKKIIIVSAFYGVTDKLLEIANLAKNSFNYENKLNELYSFHIEQMQNLGVNIELLTTFDQIRSLLDDFDDTPQSYDEILSFGELMSSRIIFDYLHHKIEISYIDSRSVIKTDSSFCHAKVDFLMSNRLILEAMESCGNFTIMPGFIASDTLGNTTTLGRNGSDYSAAIVANAVDAVIVKLWKDVNGLYSADPKIVNNVNFINKINYEEMKELACFGSKIIHIKTINQLEYRGIPILINNLYNPTNEGTLISRATSEGFKIKGVVCLGDVSIVSLALVYSTPERIEFDRSLRLLFHELRDVIVNISEITVQDRISLVIKSSFTDQIVQEIESILTSYSAINYSIKVKKHKAIITVVGSDLSDQSGISGMIFKKLQDSKITIDAIQDDLSETRISFLINSQDSTSSIKLAHEALF